jgi:ribonuclease Z
MSVRVRILGSSAAFPAPDRAPTSQIIYVQDIPFLIDCGEGTQVRLSANKIKRSRIDHIFISHLHGDHVYGLPGLITSFNLFGRTEKLHVYGPPGTKGFLTEILYYTSVELHFELETKDHSPDQSRIIYESNTMTVRTIPLNHRVPTTGYLFREKELPLNILPDMIDRYNINISEIKKIKRGADLTLPDGEVIPNDQLTHRLKVPKSYAFCSDTAYTESIIPIIRGVDALYHEATFMHDLAEKAERRKHSTARQAAEIAKMAGVELLILGHFSHRYKQLNELLAEAKHVFPNTVLAMDGMLFDI